MLFFIIVFYRIHSSVFISVTAKKKYTYSISTYTSKRNKEMVVLK